jgi:hypothetical protein
MFIRGAEVAFHQDTIVEYWKVKAYKIWGDSPTGDDFVTNSYIAKLILEAQ